MSKFENFPELKEGDLVVCGKNNGYLMTGSGAYELGLLSDDDSETVKIIGNISSLLDVLELNTEYCNSFYIPRAVFRPTAGELINWHNLMGMLADYKEYITTSNNYTCVWCRERDEVKELTVDEVSELLGYKVKIVGEENK